jgi:hypothetical protein
MRKDIRRRHDAHVRANGVCTEHSALFDATPGGQKTRAALATCVADVDRLLAVQTRSLEDRRAAAEQCRVARRALQDAAKAVVKVGKLVNLDETTMGTMRIPGAVSDDELIAYTRGLLDRVSSHADAFVAEGLPPDLLKNLETGIQGLAAARDAQSAARQRFAAAAQSIRENHDQADKTIAALEAIAVNLPAAHPEVVTKLRIARRVGPRVDAAPKPKPAPSPAPPSTTPTGQAA